MGFPVGKIPKIRIDFCRRSVQHSVSVSYSCHTGLDLFKMISYFVITIDADDDEDDIDDADAGDDADDDDDDDDDERRCPSLEANVATPMQLQLRNA